MGHRNQDDVKVGDRFYIESVEGSEIYDLLVEVDGFNDEGIPTAIIIGERKDDVS